MSNHTLLIGNSSNYVRLVYPENLGKGWHGQFRAEVKVGLFSAIADCWENPLGELSIRRLAPQLKRMSNELKGEAEFIPMEEQIEMVLAMKPLGHIEVNGHLYEQPTYGTSLRFEFQIDQTYLTEIIAQLERFEF